MMGKQLKRLTIYLPESIYEFIEQLAETEGRSISNQGAWLIERGVMKYKEEQWRENK